MVSENEIKNWYNNRHAEKGVDAWRTYENYPILLDMMRAGKTGKFLDIACGTGHLLKAASNRGLKTYGVDISKEGVKISQNNSPKSEIQVARGEALPYTDNQFDYICCIGALEHFLDINKGLKEMVRVGKTHAKYCIVVPNKDYFFWKLFGKPGTEQQDINENFFTMNVWKEIFKKNGLKVEKVYKDKWLFNNNAIFDSFNIWKIIKRIIFKTLFAVLPVKYTYQIVFILNKNK